MLVSSSLLSVNACCGVKVSRDCNAVFAVVCAAVCVACVMLAVLAGVCNVGCLMLCVMCCVFPVVCHVVCYRLCRVWWLNIVWCVLYVLRLCGVLCCCVAVGDR